jgi:6-hydroxycyclohex-1-ene-1-carbonyl-CoA dehydrogenase
MNNGKMHSWQMTERDKEFTFVEQEIPEPGEGEVVVKVAGCGVCHTDLSFWHAGVKTKHPLPLTLGHEISGTVIKGPEEWMGKKVIIPAVLPCGECELCKSGVSNICQNQKMPGNDFDGGFASHVKVPYRFLCPVPDDALVNHTLEELSVIADAISTPYQVIKKSGLNSGDLAIVIGVGGVGIYGAQISKIMGAKVIAIDISDAKLNIAKANGADAIINSTGLDIKAVKDLVRATVKELGAPKYAWKIFEFSGTKAGQELAFNLITFASTFSIVGFTMDKLELRLSNLMAFDAKAIGTWGCMPELYPEVVSLISGGKLNVKEFVELFPLSEINGVFKNTLDHKYVKRSIMVPD